jgi:rhamnosyltransferase subunit B
MLVVPYGGDQFDNGARIERVGVGTVIRRQHYRAPQVASVLQGLLEKTGAQHNARRIGQQVQQEQGVETACDAIEQFLEKKRDRDGRAPRAKVVVQEGWNTREHR